MSESESDKTLGDLLRVGALARQAYSPIAVAPPAPAGKELYGSSLQPNAVLDHYGFSQQLSITQLFRDLRVGRIFAIAEQIMWSEDGKAWMIDYAYVPNWVWQIDIDQQEDFWLTGYIERLMPHNGYDINSESLKRWIKAFKVQFSLTRLHQLDSDARKSENQTLLAAPIPSRGRKAASWWPLFAEEIAVYVHEVGIPGGVASEGQGEVIDAVLQRLSDRGIEASRTTIQPVVQAIIDRLRAAGK